MRKNKHINNIAGQSEFILLYVYKQRKLFPYSDNKAIKRTLNQTELHYSLILQEEIIKNEKNEPKKHDV